MKISKLFHWLYCAVMFLPLLIFIPNVFYFAFNEHAQLENSEPVVSINENIQYKYQTNTLNTYDDMVLNNVYHYDGELSFDGAWNNKSFDLCILNCATFYGYGYNNTYYDDWLVNNYNAINNSGINIHFSTNSVYLYFINDDTRLDFDVSDYYIYFEECDFYIISNLIDFKSWATTRYGYEDGLPYFNSSNYNVIENASYTYTLNYEDTSITGAVSNGWNQVWELPIFSWTHNTFFSAPFNYISGLFGFTSDNSISYCLSYWFSISIIWLVFDVMIYVPMLVHRWLDKASLS